MTFYLLGQFLGRAFVSWLLIYAVLLIVKRFQFKAALAASTRWPVWLAVFLLAALGLAVHAVRLGAG